MRLLHRIAFFIILVGVALLAMFVLSDIARMPDLRLLLIGSTSLLAGVLIFALRPVQKPPESGRFRLLKRKPQSEQKKKK